MIAPLPNSPYETRYVEHRGRKYAIVHVGDEKRIYVWIETLWHKNHWRLMTGRIQQAFVLRAAGLWGAA